MSFADLYIRQKKFILRTKKGVMNEWLLFEFEIRLLIRPVADRVVELFVNASACFPGNILVHGILD